MKPKIAMFILLAGACLLFAAPAGATIVTWDLTYEFSEGTPPAGLAPWLTATFDDGDTAGSVRLTMDASGLTDTEFVSQWNFNFDTDNFNIQNLQFNYVPSPNSSGPAATVTVGANSFNADGNLGHGFDIDFAFPTEEASRFGAGEVVIYDITSTEGALITASSFDFLNEEGNFPTAAHVQGIGLDGKGSGWIATPIPGAIWLLGPGLIGLIGVKRKYRKHSDLN